MNNITKLTTLTKLSNLEYVKCFKNPIDDDASLEILKDKIYFYR